MSERDDTYTIGEKASPHDGDVGNNSFYRRTILLINCCFHVPMWIMLAHLVSLVAVSYVVYPYQWLRYSLLFYSTYSILGLNLLSDQWRFGYEFIERLRHLPGFHMVSDYFPIKLVKTIDIDPCDGPYIFLYHPHGIISMGVNTAINTNGCNFDQTFPGIIRWGVTLNVCFRIPFFREWINALGFVGADKKTLAYILNERRQSIVLIPGGAVEALYTAHDTFDLVGWRRGFVKLALQTSSKLVPLVAFGENRAFSIASVSKPGGTIFKLQHTLCKLFSFSTPLLSSPFPQRNPIHVVVGQPIRFDSLNSKVNDEELVESCFSEYKLAVETLYNEHKSLYGYNQIPLKWIS
jgi:2-acylglycerol O-acyltransferase 2